MKKDLTLQDVQKIIDTFTMQRDWKQFHNPKNLTMALSVEASELMELFIWCKTENSFDRLQEKLPDVKDEIADVLIYACAFANITGIDLTEAIEQKMEKNRKKYPIEQCKGKSKKYTEYQN